MGRRPATSKQAAANVLPRPDEHIPRCVLPATRPIGDCCPLATRVGDCSKSGRLYDRYVCNPTLLRTGLPHAPDSRAKLQATRVWGATRRRASLPRGLAWLTSQAGRDGAGTCRPCSLLGGHIAPGNAPPSMSRFCPVM